MIHFTKEGGRKKVGLNLYRARGGFVVAWVWYYPATHELKGGRFRLRMHMKPRILWSVDSCNVIANYLTIHDLQLVNREALEEAWYHVGTFQPTEKAIDLYDEARTAIKEALAQEQEPVAYLSNKRQRINIEIKPQTFVEIPTVTDWEMPLYMKPPQRTWVDLTEAEIDEICLGDEAKVRTALELIKEKNTRGQE